MRKDLKILNNVKPGKRFVHRGFYDESGNMMKIMHEDLMEMMGRMKMKKYDGHKM